MSRHRAEPPRRAAPPPGRRRAERVRPRYGRLAVLGASVSVTGIAMLGGVGVLPSVAEGGGSAGADLGRVAADTGGSPAAQPTRTSKPTATTAPAARKQQAVAPSDEAPTEPKDPPVPGDSGEGKRIVFDQSDQRVWLVDEDGTVERTYPVSGSRYDNLFPGTYSVYSRSEQAWGVDDSGTMKYFVRFTQGTNGAAIGFHDIPIANGQLVQTAAQLGTPQSHGCIRQLRSDAIALWDFAPVGTEVDVTA
jgi:lipoprotein-anchoring transpeptidase ErfK/SrfK